MGGFYAGGVARARKFSKSERVIVGMARRAITSGMRSEALECGGSMPLWPNADEEDQGGSCYCRTQGAAGTAKRTFRARNVLVVAEVALALSLLIVCGMMIRSLAGVLFAKPQGDPRKMIVASVTFPSFKYPKIDVLNAFFRNLLDQINVLPGVEAAALQRSRGGQIASADNPVTATTLMESQFTPSNLLTQDYFRTMQLALLRGRLFTPADYIEKPTVMIINSAVAHKFWPNQNALGKRLTTTYPPEWYEVVGVVADERNVGGDQTFPKFTFRNTTPIRSSLFEPRPMLRA